MGIMVYFLIREMQDLNHQSYYYGNLIKKPLVFIRARYINPHILGL